VHALRFRRGEAIQDMHRALRQALYEGVRGHAGWRRHFSLLVVGAWFSIQDGAKRDACPPLD
jgi:hypothetical protein